MEHTMQVRTTTRRATIGRMTVAAVAVGGLSATAFATSAGASSKVVVSTTKNAKLGKILVSGKTLYTLKASKTPCTAACMKIWPVLALPKGVKKATAGSGVSASKLGTKTISGGVRQVTYGGKPLYWFSGDSGPGQANGNVTDEWGKWSSVVTAKSGSGSTSTATTSGSGGTAF